MRKNPFVSFIIPARNEEKMIGICLGAINGLNYDADLLESILVDNGSVDRTAEIARNEGARVFNLPNATISELRNFGAKEAKGDFLGFIDADCDVDKNWLRNALRHFEDPAVGCVGSYPAIPDQSSWVQKAWMLQNQRKAHVEEVNWLPSMNVLVRKNAFRHVGGFNETLITCEDVDFCYRLKGINYKIISDRSVNAVHFGEAKTLWDFFKKERWRGQSTFRGVLYHGLVLNELPSLALPLVYGFLMVALPVTFAYGFLKDFYLPFLANVGLTMLPPVFLSLRTSLRVRNFNSFAQLTCLYLIYALARTFAIIPLLQHEREKDRGKQRDAMLATRTVPKC